MQPVWDKGPCRVYCRPVYEKSVWTAYSLCNIEIHKLIRRILFKI